MYCVSKLTGFWENSLILVWGQCQFVGNITQVSCWQKSFCIARNKNLVKDLFTFLYFQAPCQISPFPRFKCVWMGLTVEWKHASHWNNWMIALSDIYHGEEEKSELFVRGHVCNLYQNPHISFETYTIIFARHSQTLQWGTVQISLNSNKVFESWYLTLKTTPLIIWIWYSQTYKTRFPFFIPVSFFKFNMPLSHHSINHFRGKQQLITEEFELSTDINLQLQFKQNGFISLNFMHQTVFM